MRLLPRARSVRLLVVAVMLISVVILPDGPVSASHEPAAIIRVTTDMDGGHAGGSSFSPSISGNGTRIAYSSRAGDLVAGDDFIFEDIFVYDEPTGSTILVSVGADGGPANHYSYQPAISTDGTKIAFTSWASNLVLGDTNGRSDVFLYDMMTGAIRLISVGPLGGPVAVNSSQPSINADGTIIAYRTQTDTGTWTISVYDSETETSTNISTNVAGSPADGDSRWPTISGDGTKVAYQSTASNLVEGHTNVHWDVFLYDMVLETTTLISTSTEGTPGNGPSQYPSISSDGTAIAYVSSASNLVTRSTSFWDVFVYDVLTGTTVVVVTSIDGGRANASSYSPSINADGTVIAYSSTASNLVEGDTNNRRDVFRYETLTGTTTLISTDAEGGPASHDSHEPSINADGTIIAFASKASDLVIGTAGGYQNVFLASALLRDAAPQVAGFTTSLSEDTSVGTTVGTVTASDVDGDPLSYAITAGNAAGLFTIGSTSGTITTSGVFDFETAEQHVVTVTVTDGTHNADTTVVVNVTDVGGPFDVVVDPTVDSFDDDNGSVFEADIEWLAASGITKGCGIRLFCPVDHVTRGQMAAFLTRALALPATGVDFFTDDNTSIFQDDINRLAASGITKGCDTTSFCPTDFVTRGQMAAFLTRALNLSPTNIGFFTDDDTLIFEDDINRLAASGITKGCDTNLFCPNDFVTRGQMAAFLHRALS